MKIIALEEHFSSPMLAAMRPQTAEGVQASHPHRNRDALRKGYTHVPETELKTLGPSRLKFMDESGITMQVLGYAGSERFLIDDPKVAVPLARDANEYAYEAVKAHPDRYAALATLATADPVEMVKEFERTVTQWGFKGAMLRGNTKDVFLDDKKYWGLWEAAASLDVPVYLHPQEPPDEITKAYFEGFKEIQTAAWFYSMDLGARFLRLIFAGVFDAFPNLKIILGHLGEGLPFYFDRLNDHTVLHAKRRGLKKSPAQYMLDNLYITSSGNFSVPSLLCSVMVMGIDNVMFSVDWPYEANHDAVRFLNKVPLGGEDMEKFTHKNAERILKL